MKTKLTKEQQEFFNRNFNKDAYEQAKRPIQEAISKSNTFEELWNSLSGYSRDSDFDDDYSIIYCEAELDRSKMETAADYVGVYFVICWNDDTDKGWIDNVSLYTSDTPSGEVEPICFFNPKTYEITKWDYE